MITKSIRLGEVVSYIRGITFKPEDVCAPGTSDSIVCMRTKNIQADLDESDLIAVDQRFVKREEQMLREGDILISSANSWNLVGKSVYVPELSYRTTAGGFISIVRADTSMLDPRYLYHWITTDKTQAQIRRCGRQTTNISNLSSSLFLDLEIPLPVLGEQKRIAAILDKADSLRRKRQQAIRLADDFLRAVFLDMFGDPIRKVGDRVSLAKVIDIDAPMVDPRLDEYADMLHVGPDRIEKDTGRLLECQTAREEGLISKKFLFDDSYVLYSKIRPYLRKCALSTFTGLCSADMYPVRPKVGVATREFIWALLLSNEFDRYVTSLPDRANIPKLNRYELNAFEFNLPSIQEQEKFSAIFQKRNAYTSRLDSSCSEALKLASSLQSQFL